MLGRGAAGVETVALDAVDGEDDVLVDFLVHGQLAGLAEGSCAPFIITLKRLLLCVDVGVLLQVLGQCEGLEAQDADMLLDRGVRRDMSPERESGGVAFVAAGDFAFIWSFHYIVFVSRMFVLILNVWIKFD